MYGKTFLITGVLDSLEREDAQDLIKKYGGTCFLPLMSSNFHSHLFRVCLGTVSKSVVKKLSHAVVGMRVFHCCLSSVKCVDATRVAYTHFFLFNLQQECNLEKAR